jgi:hypothetical protein
LQDCRSNREIPPAQLPVSIATPQNWRNPLILPMSCVCFALVQPADSCLDFKHDIATP